MQIRLARMLATKNIETSSRWIIVILVRESATRKIKALHWGPRVKMKILFFFLTEIFHHCLPLKVLFIQKIFLSNNKTLIHYPQINFL